MSARLKASLLGCAALLGLLGSVEVGSRLLDLSRFMDADFRFYVHNVDGEFDVPFNVEDPLLMWSLDPGYDDGLFRISSAGFRDREYDLQKPPGTFRIMALGNSVTFARGVVRPYPEVLEELLAQDRPGGLDYEVINTGTEGYSSQQGLALYRHKGRRFQPDLYTFLFGHSDAVRYFPLDDRQIMGTADGVLAATLQHDLLLHLHSYRLLRKLFFPTGRYEYGAEDNVPRVSVEHFRENLETLIALTAQDGAALVFLAPTMFAGQQPGNGAPPPELFDDIQEYGTVLDEVASAQGIPLLEVPELSAEADPPHPELFLDLCHPSQQGHELLARSLYALLLDQGLLPTGDGSAGG